MMPTLAPVASSLIEETTKPAPALARERGCVARRGAKLLLAAAFLMPLGACAVQPPAPTAQEAGTPAPAARTDAAPQPAAPQAQERATPPAARQGKAAAVAGGTPTTMPGATSGTTPGTTPASAAGGTPASPSASVSTSPSRPASSGKTGTSAATPVAERATTVGEVPTTAGPMTGPAPDTASMPGAPAAIPGTPANPATTIPQAGPAQAGAPQAAPGPSTGTLLQTILALVLVLALLAALAWAAKRYGPRMAGSSANLRMVGALNIGGRERIMVVEVGGQWIVVGASPGRVNALATMPKPDDAAHAASATLASHAPPAASFSDWLKQTIDKRHAK